MDSWVRHPIAEDGLSEQIGDVGDETQDDGFHVGKYNTEAFLGVVFERSFYRSLMATEPKDTGSQPRLKYRLNAARARDVDGSAFIPADRLHRLITRESVTEELQHVVQRFGTRVHFARSIEQIARDVCPVDGDSMVHIRKRRQTTSDLSRRRIFGILVSMGMSATIEAFLDAGVSDMHLPLTFTRHEGITKVTSSAGLKPKVVIDPFYGPNEISRLPVETFVERQREFLAPLVARRSVGTRNEIPHFEPSRINEFPWILRDHYKISWSKQSSLAEMPMFEIIGFQRDTKSTMKSERGDFARLLTPKDIRAIYEIYGSDDRHFDNEQDEIFSTPFPWDQGSPLRSLSYSNRQSLPFRLALTELIVKPLLGLSNDGQDYGGGNPFGRHEDVEPESNLWPRMPSDGSVVHHRHNQDTIELTDVVLSLISELVDATNIGSRALTHRPEEGPFGEASQTLDSGWGVFSEVLKWVNAGRDGVIESSPSARAMIIDRHDEQGDALFIKILSKGQNSSPWMRDLLVVMGTSLLEVNPEARLNTAQVTQTLQEMRDWGRSHPGYFLPGATDDERMIFFSGSIASDEQESSPAARRAQDRKRMTGHEEKTQAPEDKAETMSSTIKLNGMKLVSCSEVDHQLSILDRLRLSVECYLNEVVDWWPLPPLKRPQKGQHTELRWEYGGEEMSIILNQCEIERFSIDQNQVQGQSDDSFLPTHEPGSVLSTNASTNDQVSSTSTSRDPFWKRWWKTWVQYIAHLRNTSKSNTPGPAPPSTSNQPMETYICIDKCWTTIRDTRMRTVTALENIESDSEFFCKARDLLTQAEGNWLQRKLSWRSYTSVTCTRFYFLWDDRDEVEVEVDGGPLHQQELLSQGYQYTPLENLSIDAQMRVCAQMLLKGIANPKFGGEDKTLIHSILKLLVPPGLVKKKLRVGWGFHARQGLCMRKTMGWMGAVLAFGIAFVPYWLCAIDKLDVQTALAPASFLATVLGVGLAMLAIAQAR